MAVSILSCPPYGGYIFKAEIYDLLGFGKLKDEWIGAGSNSLVYNDTHYPHLTGNTQVFNNNDAIGQAYEKSKDLLFHLKLLKAIGSLDSQLSMADLANAASLPATTLAFAEMIAKFVGAVLFFVPLVGEAVDASMAAIRSALEMVKVAGEAGLLTYSIVKDPDNAFMAVFSTLAGAGLSRESWSRAAKERRGMKVEDAAKLGSVKTELDKIDTARGGSCKL
ncbi:hypothetical protein HDV57DRAFT_518136 [Trichoderma longibrachiatum]